MPLKGPTSDSDWKPTRTGGSNDKGRDISKDIEKWSKVRGGKSGRC